ncbi:transposase, partial [Streptococcus orisratti]
KVVTRHIWKEALEICEEIRHRKGMKELYQKRKETIERLFGTAKEYHNLRYTREKGQSKMEDKVGLTLACLNLKKLVKIRAGKPFYIVQIATILAKRRTVRLINRKRQTSVERFVFILTRESYWFSRFLVKFIKLRQQYLILIFKVQNSISDF